MSLPEKIAPQMPPTPSIVAPDENGAGPDSVKTPPPNFTVFEASLPDELGVARDLIRAIREISRGEVYLSPGIASSVVDAYLDRTDWAVDPLTSRERQILQLIAEGKTTKEVARLLNISFKTAESHRSHIMKKLDIHEVAGLVRYAIQQGLLRV